MAMRGTRRQILPCVSVRFEVPISRDRDRPFGKDRVTSYSPWGSLYVVQLLTDLTLDVLHHIGLR
jgi:hypothetical protein